MVCEMQLAVIYRKWRMGTAVCKFRFVLDVNSASRLIESTRAATREKGKGIARWRMESLERSSAFVRRGTVPTRENAGINEGE